MLYVYEEKEVTVELVHKEKKKKNAWGVGGMGRRERRVLKKEFIMI